MSPGADHERVRQSYDAVAHEYWQRFGHELEHKPLDRALLTALAEQTPEGSTIADLGCGPGHVAAYLADHGVPCVGIDLSPAMIDIARKKYPAVDFRVGDLLALPVPDEAFGAIVALYSIIHFDEDPELDAAFREMRRVLRPGGRLLLSFHIGAEVRHLSEWHDRPVDIDFHFLDPDAVGQRLERAGLRVEAALERVNHPEEVESRRAYLLAQRR